PDCRPACLFRTKVIEVQPAHIVSICVYLKYVQFKIIKLILNYTPRKFVSNKKTNMRSIDPPQIYSVVPVILPPDQLFGPLFHDVQMNHVFSDSIIFADCFPKRSPEEILSLYEIA